MPIVLQTKSETERAIALEYLRLTAEQMDQAVRNRAIYAKLARAYGLTHKAIGEALGLGESRVRQIVADQ